jgi:hypothetical protein
VAAAAVYADLGVDRLNLMLPWEPPEGGLASFLRGSSGRLLMLTGNDREWFVRHYLLGRGAKCSPADRASALA